MRDDYNEDAVKTALEGSLNGNEVNLEIYLEML